MNLFVVTPLSVFFVAILIGLPLLSQMVAEVKAGFVISYIDIDGFARFIISRYLMFLAGTIFSKVMEERRTADSVSSWIVSKIDMKSAILAVVFTCAVLTYGRVSIARNK